MNKRRRRRRVSENAIKRARARSRGFEEANGDRACRERARARAFECRLAAFLKLTIG